MSEELKLSEKVEDLEKQVHALNFMLSTLVATLVTKGIAPDNIGDVAIATAAQFENADGFRKQGEALNHMVETLLGVIENDTTQQGA
ncbi:hypothetical protein ACJJIQ_17720 [Microbulbifer sp. ANSA003]|uniref:hypothetical protein n=1 Tax=Microbulbifer sp. ANSA003 TaxID=3243360 RepID=UPI00404370E5